MQNASFVKRILPGGLTLIAVLGLLIWGIGPETIRARKVDLLYLGQQHLILVFSSMALALLIGIPSGVLLSRPAARRWAEYVMQIFNVGNTLPPLRCWPVRRRPSLSCWQPRALPNSIFFQP